MDYCIWFGNCYCPLASCSGGVGMWPVWASKAARIQYKCSPTRVIAGHPIQTQQVPRLTATGEAALCVDADVLTSLVTLLTFISICEHTMIEDVTLHTIVCVCLQTGVTAHLTLSQTAVYTLQNYLYRISEFGRLGIPVGSCSCRNQWYSHILPLRWCYSHGG